MEEYNSGKTSWEKDRDLRLNQAESEANRISEELNKHYADTQLIPEKYHQIVPLEYIYSVISTSQYLIREAIADYEREEQKQINLASVQAQQEANEIARKTRRDQNISNIVGAVQRHNISKKL